MDWMKIRGLLAAKLERQLVCYTNDTPFPVFALFADEALSGWLCIGEAKMGDFRGERTILLPLPSWILLRTHSDYTATPFHFAAVGKKSIKVASWRPLTGMKYAARHTADGIMSHINLTEFKKEFELD